jgi:adenine-specific DNA-methyltransferase
MRSRLLCLPDAPLERLPAAVQQYVIEGEEQGFHKGYKCRIRDHWYAVPSIWTPDAFMLRQIHNHPRLILNGTDATSTDTIHRVRFNAKAPPKTVAAAFLNSLTFAFAEVMGRSYGGGVLELEPNEAERLLLPLQDAERLNFDHIDTLVRRGDIEAVLAITDQTLLIEGLKLSQREVATLCNAWRRLRDRRIHRNHDTKTE